MLRPLTLHLPPPPPHHVVQRTPAPLNVSGSRLWAQALPAAESNLVWLLVDPERREAVLIDGPDGSAAVSVLDAESLRLAAIWNTHGHGDHVGINRDLAARGRLGDVQIRGSSRSRLPIIGLTATVEPGEALEFGDVEVEVLDAEGHLDGHLAFLVGDLLFCGDALFTGGSGRLFDGPPTKMWRTLERFRALPPNTRVCCAHEYTVDNLRFARWLDPNNAALERRAAEAAATAATGGCSVPSSLELELATNPYLRASEPEIAARAAAALGRSVPTDPVEAYAAVRALKDRGDYRQSS